MDAVSKKSGQAKLAWAIINGKNVHIDDYVKEEHRNESCVCLDCGKPLVARKGKIKTHHYSHKSVSDCQGETILHKLGKQVVCHIAGDGKCLKLPTEEIADKSFFSYTGLYDFKFYGRLKSAYPKAKEVNEDYYEKLTSATPEVTSGNLQFDVLTSSECFDSLAIEIFVTHEKSEEDALKFEFQNQSAIEIDLSELPWNAKYRDIYDAVQKTAKRQWIHHHFTKDFVSIADKLIPLTINQQKESFRRNCLDTFKKKIELNDLHIGRYTTSKIGVYGSYTAKYTQSYTPKLSGIDTHYFNDEGHLCIKAKVFPNPKSALECLFLEESVIDYDYDGNPFFLDYDYENFEGIIFIYKVDSINRVSIIDSIFIMPSKWQKKFDKKVIHIANERAKEKSQKFESFRRYFKGLDEKGKTSYLRKGTSIKLHDDMYSHRFNKNWKSRNRLWQLAVIKYCADPAFMGKDNEWSCDTKSIANNAFLLDLFNISPRESSKFREIDTFKLFRKLENEGYFTKDYGLTFVSSKFAW